MGGRSQERGQKAAGVCRRYGISEATFYKYKAKYVGMDVSDARRLKALEHFPLNLAHIPQR